MCVRVYEYNQLFQKYAERQINICLSLWGFDGNVGTIRLIEGNVFLKNLIFTKYFYKNAANFVLTPSFLRKKEGLSASCASEAMPHVLLAQWAAASRQPFGDLHEHLHALYVVMSGLSWYPRWQTTFEGSQVERSDYREHLMGLIFAWVAAEADLFKESQQRCVPPLSAAFGEDPGACSKMKSHLVPASALRERLLSSTSSVHTEHYF